MTLAEVHTLYDTNCRSIPSMLRQAADSIDAEVDNADCSPTVAMVAIQYAENGQINIYGWGDTDDLHAIGLIERAKHELMADIREALE